MSALVKEIERFIEKYLDRTLPVLVGVSGGIDSLALFEALCKYSGLHIGVAHVDHGWREESGEEATALKDYVESKNITFHLLKLDPKELEGNLEDACRDCRYAFFKELCEKYGYQGVMTGHHAQDQVETVLKRFLEGANLKHLQGIQSIRQVKGVTVFRPLLNVEKKELERFIQDIPFQPIHDATNVDPHFLRARMRTTIIPSLEEQFGKNISSNILQFSKKMRDVNEYLDCQVKKYLSDVVAGAMGHYLNLQQHKPTHPVEWNHLIKSFLASQRITLSRRQIETLIDLLATHSANKTIINSGKTLFIDRGIVFVPNEPPVRAETIILQHGTQTWGNWKVTVSEGECQKNSTWKDCWKGTAAVSLPRGEYSLGLVKSDVPYNGKSSLAKWWSNNKIPAFLKDYVPVIWQGDDVVHEFLTGVSPAHGNLLITLECTAPPRRGAAKIIV